MSRRISKINHCFLNWIRENRASFKFEPVLQVKSNKHFIGYFNAKKCIRFHVYRGNTIEIEGTIDGKHWVAIDWILFIVSKNAYGYFAHMLLPDTSSKYYQSLNELLVKECFETFLEWCNTTLANNNWLVMYRGDQHDMLTLKLQNTGESQHNYPYFTTKFLL